MKIEMLETVGAHTKGSTITAEDAVAERYVAAGLAKKAPGDGGSALDGLVESIRLAVAQGVSAGVGEVTKAIASARNPGAVRIDVGEQEADRTKSSIDWFKNMVYAGCPVLFPNRQAAANDRLVKVYGSRFTQYDGSTLAQPYDMGIKSWAETKDMAEGQGPTGGYGVAPFYADELLKLAAEESVVRPWAKVKRFPGREAYYPMLNQTQVPTAGQTSYYGGAYMQWEGEASAPSVNSAEPSLKQVHLVTQQLSGLAKLSRFLLADNMIGLEAEMREIFAGAIAWFEDYAFLQGTGLGQPLGVLNSTACVTTSARATANQFKLSDAAMMGGSMMPQSRMKAVWVAQNTLYGQMIQLLDASSRASYINMVGSGYDKADLAKGQFGMLLLGRPVIFTEKLPALGTTGDILFADFTKYLIGETGGLEIAASDQYAFNTNQITFRIILRVAGKPQIDLPFTQQNATTQISPFVQLHS